jgi:hypothetical protein
MRKFSKSPLRVAREALAVGTASLERYPSRYSRKDFTQPQLFAVLVLKQFFRTDDRGILEILEDFDELRRVLKLKKLPHFTTLWHAQRRMLKKGDLQNWLRPASDELDDDDIFVVHVSARSTRRGSRPDT